MTAANRIDSLTNLALSYNNQKHIDMSHLLMRKPTMTRNRIPGLAEDDIPPVVAELKALAAELGQRDNSTGQSPIKVTHECTEMAAPE